MALESSGYDNAGGDNNSSSQQQQFKLKNQKLITTTNGDTLSRLNVEMVERESVMGIPEGRYLGGLIGNKELAAIGVLVVASYLVNGEYAQIVCTALTSIPPAVFSYRVLTSVQTSKEGYHTILFYWTLYGLFAVADQFVGTAQGYNLCKAGLLGFVFLHAVRSNWAALPWDLNKTTGPSELISIFSRSIFEGSFSGSVQNQDLATFEPRTPSNTNFSDDCSEYMFPEDSRASESGTDGREDVRDVSTAFSFTYQKSMESTQKLHSPMDLEKLQKLQKLQNHQELFETMSAMTRTLGGPVEIVTEPKDRISFSKDLLEAVVQVTNVSGAPVMFALKTNADTYLVAAPTSGVLMPGQTMKVRVGVSLASFHDFKAIGAFTDKLAIDYTPISPSSATQFSPHVFQSQPRRRHAIRVFYQ